MISFKVMSTMSSKCKECECICMRCTRNSNRYFSDVHLHAEIENLRQCLAEKNNHIAKIESQFLNEADKFPNGKLASLKEEINTWEDKYTRLYKAYKRIQKVNQNLEDKLLKIVDKYETEKGAFAKDISTLSHRLADANHTIHRLSQDNSKYRNDVNLAIQLLQCKPSNFVGQKYDTLPTEVQAKVRNYISQKRKSNDNDESSSDVKSITVPISTFPPTAMVYNITKPNVEKNSDDEIDDNKPVIDFVSAAIMAKVLQDRERERIFTKHCDTCVCQKTILMVDCETQTTFYSDNNLWGVNEKLDACQINEIKCQTLDRPGTQTNQNSPKQMKIERQSKMSVVNKVKENKLSELIEPQADVKVDSERSEAILDLYDISPIEIINDRLWKNNWTKFKFDNSRANFGSDERRENEMYLNVINERIWGKDTSNINNMDRMTLIEVTNAANMNRQISDTMTSPSFSSDSILISSSEPSSSSSDLVQSVDEKRRVFSDSVEKKKLTGPRNCLMHMSCTGSKNILLDNAGHYQTFLYVSPGNGTNKQTNTALVHNSIKSAHSDRSLSTSSDEISPIPSNDTPQLQRVAEWIQSSTEVTGKSANETHIATSVPPLNLNVNSWNTENTKSSCTLIEVPLTNENNISKTITLDSPKSFNIIKFDSGAQGGSSDRDLSNTDQILSEKSEFEVRDLISFDSNNEDESDEIKEKNVVLSKNEKKISDYEVKVTKEMEETYLKLAASLNPNSLRLPTEVNLDLTIEKYRKAHKRLQSSKIND